MSASAGFADGAKVFADKGCGGCHYTDGPAKEKTIEDQLAKKGPELWYAGSKFKGEWLGAWLADPQPIRPMKYNSLTDKNAGDHPKLAAAEAGEVKDFLMGLVSKDVPAGVVTPKSNPQGKLIFIKKMPCSGCHKYQTGGKLVGGNTGPSLVDAGVRLNPDWILAYLANAQVFKPVKDMPNFDGILSKPDMEKVAAHVASFTAADAN
ncbi:MAG: hypothetical protein A3G18_00245 [Rhodospirillales bacterium RIFCSPLOWO2_12_FULL_58_28]|nr:MAG: hypothetical protein A3H92_02855 [Rhodospirillales bacterium RIFCSPLOWO2_02_FULL_58_16]OHC79898.1 MAG: hypothetical protein A3G18_00245 [Rhodospirillales bacterium RIFCSPLOWO2_12_FULL_58_28]